MCKSQGGKVITQKRLKELLKYCPETGYFFWVKPPRGRSKGSKAGTVSRGYARIIIDGRAYLGHRLAYLYMEGAMPEKEIDHINGVRDDNRYENLRLATRSQNCANKRTMRDGRKGCFWSKKRGKWIAQIRDNGKRRTIGYYDSEDEAGDAYAEEAIKVHGQYAKF